MLNLTTRYLGPELMDNPALLGREKVKSVYRRLAMVNALIGTERPTLCFIKKMFLSKHLNRPWRILDIGPGHGAKLRKIAKLAKKMKIQVELVGIDQNAWAVESAREATGADDAITFHQQNIFDYKPSAPFDLVLVSNVLYHLNNQDIVRVLDWTTNNSKAIYLSELVRSHWALLGWQILCWTLFLPLGRIIRRDGTISICKGFRREDWMHFFASRAQENLKIKRSWNFSWQISCQFTDTNR